MTLNPPIGSSFDDFLEEEGILEEVCAVALKRVLVWQLQQEMQKQGLTKSQMATALGTSRASLDRLLNPENTAVTLKTLEKAAIALGKRLYITLADPEDFEHLLPNLTPQTHQPPLTQSDLYPCYPVSPPASTAHKSRTPPRKRAQTALQNPL